MMRAKWIALSMLLAGCASQTNATDDATTIAWLPVDATSTCAPVAAACPEAGAVGFSTLNVSGTIALADVDLESLSFAACLESVCIASGGPPFEEGLTLADGAMFGIYSYGTNTLNPGGGWSITLDSSGHYSLTGGDMSCLTSFTGTSPTGTFTLTISSGGTTLYSTTATASCQVICPTCPGGNIYETCTVQL
jgi:hypothetical protein